MDQKEVMRPGVYDGIGCHFCHERTILTQYTDLSTEMECLNGCFDYRFSPEGEMTYKYQKDFEDNQ